MALSQRSGGPFVGHRSSSAVSVDVLLARGPRKRGQSSPAFSAAKDRRHRVRPSEATIAAGFPARQNRSKNIEHPTSNAQRRRTGTRSPTGGAGRGEGAWFADGEHLQNVDVNWGHEP